MALLALGPHRFRVEGLNYQKLEREYAGRWMEHFTANGGHVDHFLGATPRTLTISGVLFPQSYGGYEAAEAMGASIEAGLVLPLFSAQKPFGLYKALSLRLSDESTGPNGVVEAKYDLELSLYQGGLNRNSLMSRVLQGRDGLISAAKSAASKLVERLF
ncbi:phage tail protein [Polycladidibacter hongkongensis]|uniref:phage tail protein n=1 Tax=Polycladidibacter hongkongensis TaxID=1647556 RepID=UPI00082C0CB9|nr:phage tail protein [Pseudovibrio hongkongensis]